MVAGGLGPLPLGAWQVQTDVSVPGIVSARSWNHGLVEYQPWHERLARADHQAPKVGTGVIAIL
jgi:hypothetical protein